MILSNICHTILLIHNITSVRTEMALHIFIYLQKGNTAKSLNLPNLRLLDLDRGQKKVPNPNGIITNPRMKNPHLNTLRDTMFEFNAAALPNITERSSDAYDNSFDSLLSPSKTCDWLSSDPFGYSSGEESPDEENDRSGDRQLSMLKKLGYVW